ncbi:MAG TPA: DUF4286 family protein [Flavisolibacter sp.]|jgi:hypothetical protein|nr:DUF4286 family protein [Flavisolibacter sp.]
MIIYNVTIQVDNAIAAEWLTWLQEVHIPDVMATNCFTEFKIVRLLEVDESDGPTYATQYFAESKADYNRYIEIYAPALRQQSINKWGDNFVAFRTLMKIIA